MVMKPELFVFVLIVFVKLNLRSRCSRRKRRGLRSRREGRHGLRCDQCRVRDREDHPCRMYGIRNLSRNERVYHEMSVASRPLLDHY